MPKGQFQRSPEHLAKMRENIKKAQEARRKKKEQEKGLETLKNPEKPDDLSSTPQPPTPPETSPEKPPIMPPEPIQKDYVGGHTLDRERTG